MQRYSIKRGKIKEDDSGKYVKFEVAKRRIDLSAALGAKAILDSTRGFVDQVEFMILGNKDKTIH